MKISGVDFNDNWVAKFKSADEFANAPSTQHLYPELKKIEDRKEQLRAVWNLIVKPVQPISHDSNADDDKPQNIKRRGAAKRNASTVAANDGASPERSDEPRGGHEFAPDNLAGENGVPSEDSGEKGKD